MFDGGTRIFGTVQCVRTGITWARAMEPTKLAGFAFSPYPLS